MRKVRRISLYGGPGVGKSTLAAWLFAELKAKGYDVEHSSEYVKSWAFLGRSPQGMDQCYIFGHQMHREELILKNTNATVVSECPLLLGVCYAKRMNMPGWEHLKALAKEFDKIYPSLNFLIVRQGVYKRTGRFENIRQARETDKIIEETVGRMPKITWDDKQELLEKAIEVLK